MTARAASPGAPANDTRTGQRMTASHGRRASFALIDTIADFHLVDYEAIGLGDLGKPAGFAERQVRGWNDRWQDSHWQMPWNTRL